MCEGPYVGMKSRLMDHNDASIRVYATVNVDDIVVLHSPRSRWSGEALLGGDAGDAWPIAHGAPARADEKYSSIQSADVALRHGRAG